MAYTITGKIYGEGDYENGLANVSVTEVGTTKGVTTNASGNFSFTVSSASAQVRFSILGYKELVIKANEFNQFETLESEFLDLEEITVTNGNKKDNTLLILAICATTIIVTATIISKKRNRPQRVQLK